MCTVSLIKPLSGPALAADVPISRLVFNRDERRERPTAALPVIARGLQTRFVMPVDPQGPGTWLAVNDAGLVFALLNLYAAGRGATRRPVDAPRPASARSRGRIIPLLADATSLEEASRRISQLAWRQFSPFRLLVFGDEALLDARPRLDELAIVRRPLGDRFMATSSSAQPYDAARLRAQLFERIVPRPDRELQDLFHAHRWQTSPELSVRMTRPEARTVSRTVVERLADRIVVRYAPLEDGAGPAVTTLTLDLPIARREVA